MAIFIVLLFNNKNLFTCVWCCLVTLKPLKDLVSFDHHTKYLCKSLVCHFRNLFKIRKYLNKEPAAKFVYAFITSKLDFCNSLFYGLPNYQLRKLQLLQNMAARFVSGARKFDYIRPILVKLHYLPISYRAVFKLLSQVF